MTTQPQVQSVRRSGNAVELDLHVPAALSYFPGHFPRFAMLPGVVQLDWAIALAREYLALRGVFRKLAGLKFQHPILPGAQVTLSLEQPANGEIVFAYTSAAAGVIEKDLRSPAPVPGTARTCSAGRIVFGPSGSDPGE
jgi:3-hydroxymyristoyl/3-hydroxydecanoyl-(acyl carrier protein) dehydratase